MFTGHCRRSENEMVSKVVLWDPKHSRRKQGRPAMTYTDSLVKDTVDELDTCTRDRGTWRTITTQADRWLLTICISPCTTKRSTTEHDLHIVDALLMKTMKVWYLLTPGFGPAINIPLRMESSGYFVCNRVSYRSYSGPLVYKMPDNRHWNRVSLCLYCDSLHMHGRGMGVAVGPIAIPWFHGRPDSVK